MPFPVAYNNVLTIPPGAGLSLRIVIDGVRGAIFEYDQNNALIGSWASSAGTDPYGNPYPEGLNLTAASINGMIEIVIGIAGGSQISLNPNVNQQFNVTTLIAGIIQAAEQFHTTDVNEVVEGALGSVLLNTGSATKMSTVLMSPFGGTGSALVLESENDGSTDTAVITIGTVTTPDSGTTIVFTPILTVGPYFFLLYSGQSGQATVTKTSGSGTIPIPAGVTVGKAECWGAGGGGGTAQNFGAAAAGGGEYAAEPSLAVTGGGTVPYAVGAAGTGGVLGGGASTDGGSSTLTGSSVTVTANGGQKGSSTASPGNGGSGSTNSVHFNGGSGAAGATGSTGGGGGGGSGGTSHAGNAGHAGVGPSGGSGGIAVAGGGRGGSGGNVFFPGSAGGSPGGGGGGSSAGTNGGNGANGQVRLTYSTGAPAILLSVAAAAGTDQFGTAYPAGAQIASGLSGFLSRGPAADFTQFNITAAAFTQCTKAWTIPANDAKVGTTYRLTFNGNGTQGSTQEILSFAATSSGFAAASINQTFVGASQTFAWKCVIEVTIITTGAGGTANYSLWCSAGGGDNNGYSHAGAFDTTNPFTLEGQGKWGATTGGPTFSCLESFLERIGP